MQNNFETILKILGSSSRQSLTTVLEAKQISNGDSTKHILFLEDDNLCPTNWTTGFGKQVLPLNSKLVTKLEYCRM